jgi:hypothetical protein
MLSEQHSALTRLMDDALRRAHEEHQVRAIQQQRLTALEERIRLADDARLSAEETNLSLKRYVLGIVIVRLFSCWNAGP